MSSSGGNLQAIKYTRGSLELLDQRLLPHEFTYLRVPDPATGWHFIKDMVVRGAPLIGVTAVLTIAVDLVVNKAAGAAFESADAAAAYVAATADYLVTRCAGSPGSPGARGSQVAEKQQVAAPGLQLHPIPPRAATTARSRPTAVNLADGLSKVKAAAVQALRSAATSTTVVDAVVAAAEAYFEADIACNQAIGRHGAEQLLVEVAARRLAAGHQEAADGQHVRVLTHCNTGSLATAGYGTALGIIRALHKQGHLQHAYCTETRPYNQGARLTAYELTHDGIPTTLVCDSATAALLASGQVDAVVVGADRVVANGDTANKIGTHMLAIIASHHGVPFFVAAPTTTLDPNLATGDAIEIEHRPAEEITHFRGTRVVTERVQVWNPSFDVAPGKLIDGIVTELGVVPKQGGKHQVREFLASQRVATPPATPNGVHQEQAAPAANQPVAAPGAQAIAFTEASVIEYVAARPELAVHVGPADTRDSWAVREVGDGNINFVYIVEGPAGGLAIKQSLPYVRCVGESWPLTLDRLRIEAEALRTQGRLDPDHVPAVYVYDAARAVIVMRYLAPPAIILRKGLIQGHVYPALADHISTFLARTLFGTSVLALSSAEFRARQAEFNNPEMCALTETVIFKEPYIEHPNNRHTDHPLMHAHVQALRADQAAKLAITALKRKFMTQADALLHGDLHTGSIMVTPHDSWVIDPEFAFHGPAAFDIAKFLANLLLALFASFGLEADAPGSRTAHREWLSESVASVWTQFASKFTALWSGSAAQRPGDLCPSALSTSTSDAQKQISVVDVVATYQAAYLEALWLDTVPFMGAFIIRRLVGIAHVADMDAIVDIKTRASCEARALAFGRQLLTQPQQYVDVHVVVRAAAEAAALPEPSAP